MVGCCECNDEASASGTTGLISYLADMLNKWLSEYNLHGVSKKML
jgi:hypothetical protein